MNEPEWAKDETTKERAERMGLTEEPTCPACAEYIYCGTSFGSHKRNCEANNADEKDC